MIPSAPIGEIVREHLDSVTPEYLKLDDHFAYMEVLGDHGLMSPRLRFCEKAGITPRQLYRIVEQESKWIDFDIADRIICAIGQPGLWLTEPLVEHYLSVDLERLDAVRPCTQELLAA